MSTFEELIESQKLIRDFSKWAKDVYKERGDSFFLRLEKAIETVIPTNAVIRYAIHYVDSLESFELTAKTDDELKTLLKQWAIVNLPSGMSVFVMLFSGEFFRVRAGTDKSGVPFLSDAMMPIAGVTRVRRPIQEAEIL
jgi:hypothetical protein